MVDPSGNSAGEFDIRRPVAIEVEYESIAPGTPRPYVNLHFYNDEGVRLFVSADYNNRSWWISLTPA